MQADSKQKYLGIRKRPVRDQYVNLKEMYLSRWWDKDHPSFVVYIEAVNNVYNKYFT